MEARTDIKFINGVTMNVKYPETFHIPSVEEKKSLKRFDYVKLNFLEDGKPNEKMWVAVKEVISQKEILGYLDNDPFSHEKIQCGELVKFTSDDILHISGGAAQNCVETLETHESISKAPNVVKIR